MIPSQKTARLAAYLKAIDAARLQGCTWGDIQKALEPVIQFQGPERLRRLTVNARRAVASGRYSPMQRPFPGDTAAEGAAETERRSQAARPQSNPLNPRPFAPYQVKEL